MDTLNILNIIIFIVIIIYILNILIKKYKTSEHFQEEEEEAASPPVFDLDLDMNMDFVTRNIDTVNEDSNLFGKFCKKIHILDKESPINEQYKHEIELDELKLKQKRANVSNLVKEILDLQIKLFNSDEEIEQIRKYRQDINDDLKIKLQIIDKAYENVKNTFIDKIKINVKLE